MRWSAGASRRSCRDERQVWPFGGAAGASGRTSSVGEQVADPTVELGEQSFEGFQRNILFTEFEAVKGGTGEAEFFGELGIRQVATPTAQIGTELKSEFAMHGETMRRILSHMWDI